MEYTLFLDESGNFKEEAKMPSVVAGYLVEGKALDEKWAKNILKKVKESSSLFNGIDIDHFHGMNDFSKPMQEFSVRVMESLKDKEIELISFQSKRNAKIVDSDITYLNVFALGLIRLFEKLVIAKKGSITINVVYASRIRVVEKEATDRYVQIEMEEYKRKIEEHLALKIAQWSNQYRQKLSYTLTMGSATRNPLLMLADAINYGTRGCFQNFDAELKNRVKALKVTTLKVHSADKWTAIRNSIVKDNFAAGIISWYGDNDVELAAFSNEFEDILSDTLATMDSKLFSIHYNMLSAYITNIITQRKLDYACELIRRLQEEFLPFLGRYISNINKYHFDLAFQMFTAASHKGDYDLSTKCIVECDSYLGRLDISYESLDYYFSYKIRVVEHLKNVFRFSEALKMLEKLEELQDNLISTYSLVGDFEGLGSDIKSVTLGKIYGSKLQVFSQLVNKEPALLEEGRSITDKALAQFGESFSDKSRIMQSRAALEYSAGYFDEALKWLSMSLGLDKDASADSVVDEIVKNLKGNVFMLMHYAKLMGAAARAGVALASTLYNAWDLHDLDKKLGKKTGNADSTDIAIYPYYVIYWNLAVARSMLRSFDKSSFRIAEYGALANPGEITVYAAGIAIYADRLYYNKGHLSNSDIKSLLSLVKEFINSDVPDNFKELFAPWEAVLSDEKLKSSVKPEEREALKDLINRVPIV